MDIRLPEKKFHYKDRDYILRCNMNVIADAQEMCGGTLGPVLDDNATLKGVLVWLAAMMNDYADEHAGEEGWEDYTPYTGKTLGREIAFKDIPRKEVLSIVREALFEQVGKEDPEKKAEKPETQTEENSKN